MDRGVYYYLLYAGSVDNIRLIMVLLLCLNSRIKSRVLKGSLYLDDNSVQLHVAPPAPARDLLRVGVRVGEPLVGGHLPPPPLLAGRGVEGGGGHLVIPAEGEEHVEEGHKHVHEDDQREQWV